MQSLNDRIRQSDSLLASYAVKHGDGLGREHDEPEDATRLRFQRDRGRIIHTQAFRRLKGKTQVFIGGKNDHHRTRLTHTLEVTGISRDMARALQLNEDLAECIALAHDLGHPPFGHAGEISLNEWMSKYEGGFEHNLQSHRILTVLEGHSSLYAGLNVNLEILEGLLKHTTPFDHPELHHTNENTSGTHSLSLEAQIVDMADEIAYTAHDCEDGLKAQLFLLDDLLEIPLVLAASNLAAPRSTSLHGALIHILVTDLYEAVEKQLLSQRINTLDSVYTSDNSLIAFSEDMRSKLDALRSFLWANMYNHPAVIERSKEGQKIIQLLCAHYIKNPNDKVLELQKQTGGLIQEAVKDYVAGMTDSFACTQAKTVSSL